MNEDKLISLEHLRLLSLYSAQHSTGKIGELSDTMVDALTVITSNIPPAVAVKGDKETSYRTGNVNLTLGDIGALGFVRLLTDSDDLDQLTDHGVYVYYTNGIPKNAPYSNAAVVEVFGAASTTSQIIQRVTRYGAAGYMSFRALSGGKWMAWSEVALKSDIPIAVSKAGDTMTGNLVIGNATSGKEISLGGNASGKSGMFSQTYGRWIVCEDADGHVTLAGNADTATKLAVPRMINGVAFDGTGDVEIIDNGAIRFKRQLTAADDLDAITEHGVYYYATNDAPKNAPYANGSVVEVLGRVSTGSHLIQRVTRSGTVDHTSFRVLNNGTWLEWGEVALRSGVVSKTGDVMTGNLVVENAESGKRISLGGNADGKSGMFSQTYDKWIVREDPDGKVNLYGNADTATTLEKTLEIAKGGTGAANAEAARIALGITPANIGAFGFVRQLTSADDMDSLVTPGVYYYTTANLPQNAPYSNASVVEVIAGPSSTTQLFQRVTRYGSAGYTSFRALSGGNWMAWRECVVDSRSLNATFAQGATVLSDYQYGNTLPAAGTPGRIFFLKKT